MADTTPLRGKTAVVTGASGGMGRAIAERLAKDGAHLVVHCGTRLERAQQVVESIQAGGGVATLIQADLSRVSEAQRLIAQADEWAQSQGLGLDILVNNAGRFVPKSVDETTEADFDAIFAVNTKAPFFTMQAAARVIRDGGSIVNISSVLTQMTFAGATVHLGSKAALEQFTRGLALEVASRGITVNTVLPGITDTGVLTDEVRAKGVALSPFKRVGEPRDIADVVAFLVSDEARWLTGQRIQAAGGMVM
ncbi:MAG: SDR family oxidoreductase [Nitrospiraceae bacterium]